jgi:hypothetical protein
MCSCRWEGKGPRLEFSILQELSSVGGSDFAILMMWFTVIQGLKRQRSQGTDGKHIQTAPRAKFVTAGVEMTEAALGEK